MQMHRHWLVWIEFACAACGNSSSEQPPPPDGAPDATPDAMPDAPPGTVEFMGTVVGPAPAQAHVIGFWSVEVGPDHAFKLGDGSATATTFELFIPKGPVPDDALNNEAGAKWGVGLPVLVDASEQIPDGPVVKEFPVRGLSTQYAIIFRTGADVAADSIFTWVNGFALDQLSCGKCVKSTAAGTFDTYTPVQCSELVLEAATDPATLDPCDWI